MEEAPMDAETTIGSQVADHPTMRHSPESYGPPTCSKGALTDLEGGIGFLNDRNWMEATIPEIAAHILVEHHLWLKANWERITELVGKLATGQGQVNPILLEIAKAVQSLRSELEPHMEEEERFLFPLALMMREGTALADFSTATMDSTMQQFEVEHRSSMDLLDLLRELTDDFRPPEHADGTWWVCWDALSELELNTRAHLHMENEVLHLRLRGLGR